MAMQSEVSFQNLPPQNIEAEQAVLGAVLIENSAINNVVDILSPDDFYEETHRRIYSAMLEMFDAGEPIDLVTLTNVLRGSKALESVGGASYLNAIVSLVPTAANVKNHARIVREKAVLRKLIHSATDIITQGYDESNTGRDVETLLDQAEKSIFEITQDKIGDSFVPLRQIVSHSFHMVEQLYERKEMITGLPTGYVDLDKMTAGFQPSDLIIVAGRPSMGKTAFCLNISTHASIEHAKTIAVFSLEMTKEQLVLRMLCSEARVDASRLKAEHGRERLVVDYLQRMRGNDNQDNRGQEISTRSRALQPLAKELHL